MATSGPSPNPARVLVVAPLYHTDRGGLGRQAVLLTERLAELGARPLVATRAMTGLPARPASPRVEVVPLRAGRPHVHNYERPDPINLLTSLRFSAALGRLMRRRRRDYDLLHYHGASLPLLLTLPLAKLLGKRVVAKVAALHQGVEAGDLRGHYGPLGPRLADALRRVDAFVATTGEIEAALLAEGYAAEQVARIPNFVETARFRPLPPEARAAARLELGWEGRTVVLHSGRLTARKATDVLLEAFLQASAGCPERRPLLVFLGDGPERAALEARARAAGAEERVSFVGFHSDVERWLGAADVFVIASRVEGFPNALLEAMGAGLPVVATRLGGALEAVEEGQQGLLVPAGQAAPLAQALGRLLGDAALRTRLGQAARERVEARFTLDATAPRYLELYARLLARPGR